MGCSSPQNATIPHNIPAGHYNRLMQVSDINHQLNVNKKYEHLSRIRDGPMVGTGFKKTFAYDCLTTPEELKAKRKQFWETRVNGASECWNAIKMAVEEPDQQTGKAILQSVRVTFLNGSIQMNVDARCNKYEVPVFCINEPMSYAHETIAEKNLNHQYQETPLKLKIRSVLFPNEDLVLEMNSKTEISEVKTMIRSKKSLDADRGIRLFFNGREMSDNRTLGNYNYIEGMVIQAMIR